MQGGGSVSERSAEGPTTAAGVVVQAAGGALRVALVPGEQAGGLALPGGRIAPGEGIEDAARRHVVERTGLGDLLLLGPLGARQGTACLLFLAPEDADLQPPAVWTPLDDPPATLQPAPRALLAAERARIEAAVTRRLVQRQFTRQAADYARSESHARDRDLTLLVAQMRLRPSDRVLDVATGTGFTAFALARVAGAVVGLDLTPGMLREARALSGDLAVRWVAGDAGALPFRNDVFDAVAVRRAPHHFADLRGALREMLRVLRPGGVLGVVDQVPPEDDAGRELMEQLEKLRDPSHVEALSASRWRRLLEGLGVAVAFQEVVERPVTFEAWLELAGADPARRQAVQAALAAAPRAARQAVGDDGSTPPSFMKRWVVLVGTKR
jgi:ubiquinone/menaquinone biosynthesis C-methylase UbiE/ADP-ribose pyrophosphatase YjhB (NUDIX family)